METARIYRFRLPREHGAWWTFFSCLAAGLLQALAWEADPVVLACLAAGMAFFFMASHWVLDLALALLGGQARAQAAGSARGWSLVLGGACLIAFALVRAEAGRYGLGLSLLWALAGWGLAILAVLVLRIRLHERSLGLLVPSAALLTAPAMVLGALAFGGLGSQATAFWALWAGFFAAGVLYIHTWLRGAQLPRWRIYLASLPYFALAAVLAWQRDWPALILAAAFAARAAVRLKDRLEDWEAQLGELHGGPAPKRLPTDGAEIRKLGWEQVAWSLALGGLWTWSFLP